MAIDFLKLFHTFFTSSIRREDADTRIVFLAMLVMSDRNGYLQATDDAIASFANVSLEETRIALARLQSPDPDSTTTDEEGRRVLPLGPNRWHIVNRRKYWELQKEEERRDYLREAKQRQRERDREKLSQSESNVNTGQQVSTAVNGDQHASPSPSPSLSHSLSKLEESPLFKDRPIETGPKPKKSNPQAERVRAVEKIFEEYGAKPVPANLIAKWLAEFTEEEIDKTLRELGIRGALMKGPEYIYAALRNTKGGNDGGKNGRRSEAGSGSGKGARSSKYSEYDR